MTEKKRSQLSEAMRNYARLMKPYRKQMAIAVLLINIMQILALAEPMIGASMFRDLVEHRQNPIRLISLKTAENFGILLFLTFIQRAKVRYVRWLVVDSVQMLYCQLFEKLLKLSGNFHEMRNTTELHGTITKGIDSVEGITFLLANEFAPLAVMFVATSVATSYYSKISTAIIVPVVLVFMYATIKVRSIMADKREARHQVDRENDRHFGATVLAARTVWAFCREKDELKTFASQQAQIRALLVKEYFAYDFLDLGRNILVGGGRSAVMLICMLQAVYDPSRVPQVYVVTSLAARLFQACYNIGSVYDRFIEGSSPVAQMIKVQDEPITISDPEDPVVLERVKGEIHFQNACYAYPSNPNKLALDDLTLTIQPGEKIGVVGESGGGKTTLTKALLRFVDLTSGSILIDGINICRLMLKQLRSIIGCVAQDIEIFDGTIAMNILIGRASATQEEVIAAAKKAHAHDFILSLPDGYATRVGDRGLRLSGGQRQRIGVARVFLKDAPIILFDEATSNVDAGSDVAIHEAVADLVASGKTVIVIAHRLATVANADRIVYIHDGKIVEVGTPSELKRKGGYYAKLLRKHEEFDQRGHAHASN